MLAPLGRPAIQDCCLLALSAFFYIIAAPPHEWTGAAWFALTPFYLALQRKTLRTGFVLGVLYGVLFSAGLTRWAVSSVITYFSFSFPLAVLSLFLSYCISAGIYTGLAASLSCLLMRSPTLLVRAVGVPAVWVSSELVRSYVFFGFCWEFLGYTQYRSLPLIQIADLTGVYGLSFLLALSSYTVSECVLYVSHLVRPARRNGKVSYQAVFPWTACGALTVGIVLTVSYGAIRLHQYQAISSASPLTVAVAQGDVPSEQRWQRSHYARILLSYMAVTRRGIGEKQPDLTVWPEFAIGFYLDKERALRAQLGRFIHQLKTSLLLGAPRTETSRTGKRYYNSAYLISPDGEVVDVYDKMRLIPFSEYRPFAFPELSPHTPEHPSEFASGQRATIFPLRDTTFGVVICYEVTYPSLVRRLVQGGAQLVANISNDTWLVAAGEAAAAQHFSMAVLRAVENRRYLVRAATSGVAGFVDLTGRPYALSTGEGVSVGEVSPIREVSVYTRYGDWFAFACVGIALAGIISVQRQ